MKYILKTLLIIGIAVGSVIALFEYFGGRAAITTPATSPTSWVTIFHFFFSSPWALISIAILGVFVLLAISVWRRTGEAAGGFFWNQKKSDLTPFGRLLAVIAFVIWFIFAVNYVHGESWINNFFFGISERERWVVVVILVALAHLPLSPLANFIVPTKGAFMRAVVYTTFVVVVAYAGSRAHTTHDFFNPETGNPTAYIDPTTNTVYHHDGWAPDTGEKLAAITKEAAKKIKQQSSIDIAKQKADRWLKDALSKESSAPPPPPAPPKEEKKIIVAKKQWQRQAVSEADIRKASSWSLPELPAIRFSMRHGQIFPWPAGGDGICAGVFLEEGELKDPGSGDVFRFISRIDCRQKEIEVECATSICRGFAGYAFKHPRGVATLVVK